MVMEHQDSITSGVILPTRIWSWLHSRSNDSYWLSGSEISEQPKVVEDQAVKLLQKVQEKIDSTEGILHQMKQVILGWLAVIRWCEAEMNRLRDEALLYKAELDNLKLTTQLEKDAQELTSG